MFYLLLVVFSEPLINSEVSAAQGCVAKIDGYKPLVFMGKVKTTLFVFRAFIIHG
jgi:hypothetical protein